MDILLMFYIILFIIGGLLVGVNLFVKNENHLLIFTIISCIFIGFIGYINYSSLPTNYTNHRMLTLCLALTSILPCILNILKIKNNKIKPLTIKILTITILIVNLSLIVLL